MKKLNSFESFEIIYGDFNECPSGPHGHNFFELVYVISGNGTHVINNEQVSYVPENLFLLSPDDYHYFKIAKRTCFLFVHFSREFIDKINSAKIFSANGNSRTADQLMTPHNKSLVKHIIAAIIDEYKMPDRQHQQLFEQLLTSLIIIIARTLSTQYPERISVQTDSKIMDILNYVHQNISSPEKTKTSVICAHLGISPNYLGRYFKKQSGTSLLEYIANCRLKIIENRLLYSDLRINEISRELTFADVSHFNKFFKRHRGMNPLQFKKISRDNPEKTTASSI